MKSGLAQIRAAVWANQNGTDGVWFNVTVSRLYKTGTTWNQSSSFRRDDLPLAAKALEMAYAWIWEHQAPASQEHTAKRNGSNAQST